MSRTLSSEAQTEIAKQAGCEPITVLKIEWGGINTVYYSTKTLGTGSGADIDNAIGNITSISDYSEEINTSDANIVSNLSVSLSDIKSMFDISAVAGRICTVYQAFISNDLLVGETIIFKGVVSSPIAWVEDHDLISFTITSVEPSAECGFSLDQDSSTSYTINPDIYDKAWPIVFGKCFNIPAIKVQKPILGSLTIPMSSTSTTVEIENGEDFPQSTVLRLLIGSVVFTGTIVDNTLTIISSNLTRYPTLTIAARPSGDPDEDNYRVLWFTGNIDLKNMLLYSSALGTYRICYRQETVGSTTKCWFSGRWGSWTNGIWQSEFPTSISDNRGVPDTTWAANIYGWTIKADTVVMVVGTDGIPTSASESKYVCSYNTTTVKSVKAYRDTGEKTLLCDIPSSYYTVANEDAGVGSNSTTITFDQDLTTREGEGWESDIYVSMEASTPYTSNTSDVIKQLITEFSSLSVDATSFASVNTALTNYPSNFALSKQGETIQICSEIAWQARCSLAIRNQIVYIEYLSISPSSLRTLDGDDVEVKTLHVGLTDDTNLVTVFKGSWLPSREKEAVVQNIILRENENTYGVHETEYDFYIYNIESHVEKSCTFWSHRYASVWKTCDFDSFLDNFDLEINDCVTQNLGNSFVSTASTKALIHNVMHHPETGLVAIDLWLPILAGTMIADTDAWMLDTESLIDVDMSHLSMYDYTVDIALEDSFRPDNYDSDEDLENSRKVLVTNKIYTAYFNADVISSSTTAKMTINDFECPNWSEIEGVDYIIGEARNYGSLNYICITSHTPDITKIPGTSGGSGYWEATDDASVSFDIPDLNANADDSRIPLVKDSPYQVVWFGNAWVFNTPIFKHDLYEEVVWAYAVADASTGATIVCELEFMNEAAWADTIYYEKNRWLTHDGDLYKSKLAHKSVAALNEPGIGTSQAVYWELFTLGRVTVTCNLIGISNLSDANPTLEINDKIRVKQHEATGVWESIEHFAAGATGSGDVRQLAEVTVAISYTGAQVYTVQKINAAGTKDGSNITIDELITDANGSSPAAVDMREYFPWYADGDVVEIFQSSIDTTDKWYLADTMTFIGSGTVNSLAVDEATKRLKAVYV